LKNFVAKIRQTVRGFLGISKLHDEIETLKKANEQLGLTIKDHEKSIAVLAVLQAKTMKDVLAYFDMITKATRKPTSPIIKKVDDDIIN